MLSDVLIWNCEAVLMGLARTVKVLGVKKARLILELALKIVY